MQKVELESFDIEIHETPQHHLYLTICDKDHRWKVTPEVAVSIVREENHRELDVYVENENVCSKEI